jgi:hypothetical protein
VYLLGGIVFRLVVVVKRRPVEAQGKLAAALQRDLRSSLGLF